MKKFGIFLIVLAAIGAGVYFTAPSLESIVQTVVHKYGSQVTGTEVNLGGFKLSLLKGEVEINNLTVANPENYSQPNIMSVGRGTLADALCPAMEAARLMLPPETSR